MGERLFRPLGLFGIYTVSLIQPFQLRLLGERYHIHAVEFEHVILVSADQKTLTRVSELATDSLTEKDRKRVAFLSPGDFFVFLEELDAKTAAKEETVRGYKVKVKYRPVDEAEKKARKEAIMKTVLEGLKRAKKQDK